MNKQAAGFDQSDQLTVAGAAERYGMSPSRIRAIAAETVGASKDPTGQWRLPCMSLAETLGPRFCTECVNTNCPASPHIAVDLTDTSDLFESLTKATPSPDEPLPSATLSSSGISQADIGTALSEAFGPLLTDTFTLMVQHHIESTDLRIDAEIRAATATSNEQWLRSDLIAKTARLDQAEQTIRADTTSRVKAETTVEYLAIQLADAANTAARHVSRAEVAEQRLAVAVSSLGWYGKRRYRKTIDRQVQR